MNNLRRPTASPLAKVACLLLCCTLVAPQTLLAASRGRAERARFGAESVAARAFSGAPDALAPRSPLSGNATAFLRGAVEDPYLGRKSPAGLLQGFAGVPPLGRASGLNTALQNVKASTSPVPLTPASSPALAMPALPAGSAREELFRLLTPAAAAPLQTGTGLVGHWKFDEGTGATASDSSPSGYTGSLTGPAWASGKVGPSALSFDGADDKVSFSGAPGVANNFTISFWADPRSPHEIDSEMTFGTYGATGQKYAWWPTWRAGGDAGAGVSVGANGVSVYEHGPNFMAAILVHQAQISGWTHVAVVYEDKRPKLYLNGVLARTGLQSPRDAVWAVPQYVGGEVYGYYDGLMDDVRLYSGALTAQQVAALMDNQPYTGTPVALPGVIQAEDFDIGGEGVTYHDTTAGNAGGLYRQTDVDVCNCGSPYGYSVGWTTPGEWLEYTVDVPVAGTFRFDTLTASADDGCTIHWEVDGVPVTGPIVLPNTGAWGSYGLASQSGIQLSAGRHVLRLAVDVGGFLIDSVTVSRVNTAYGGTPVKLPGTVQAEDFDNGGQGVAYYDTTAGNAGGQYRADTDVDIGGNSSGYNVGWTIPGEWTKYTVDVEATDTYTLQAIVSTPYSGSAIRLEVDGVNVTGTMEVPNTGAYGWWHALSKPDVQLTAGRHELKLVVESGGFIIDSIRALQPVPAAPSSLVATAASTTQVNLTWVDNSANETGFKIERKAGAAGTYAQVGTVGAGVTSFSDPGLSSSTQYFYRVRATNAGGDSVASNEATAATQNAAPSVSLTAPAGGDVFTAPANIALTASASDPDGTIAKVEFFSGAALLATVTQAPYSFTWDGVGAGSYTLTAKATDNAGASTTSSAAGVTVALPVVSIAATDDAASEQGPDAGVFTVSRTGSTGASLTVGFTVFGTAANGTDYAATGLSVTIPAGASSQAITITPADDAAVEGNETATLTLSANAAYSVGSPASATVTISDNDTHPPAATITSPAAGAVFTAPATVTINANASDPDGAVAKVEFYQGTTKLGEDTTAPYSFTWNNVTAGSYSLTAKATDNVGATGTSAPVGVIVNALPAVSLTAPAGGSVFDAPASLTLEASASDADGTIAKVEFLRNGTLIGEDASAPFSLPWASVPSGSYALTARATDDRGAQTTSAAVNIVVNSLPSVSLTSPVNNQAFGAGESVSITANASDADGAVAKVEFYQGATKLGEDTTAPYSFSWNNVAAGGYSLTAKVTDNLGATRTSAPVGIIVNAPPAVSLSAPAGGTVFNAPASVALEAVASDPDGAIAKVEFFRDGTLIGEDTAAPFSLLWGSVPAGTYSLTARATDDRGAQITSAAVGIVVNALPAVSITAPSNNQNFGDGENVAITATASDSDGAVAKVEFFRGATKLGEDVTAPYGFAWQNATEGSHALTAVATDDRGGQTTSTPVSINVTGGFEMAALSPANRTGAAGVDPLSRNFNWSLPLVSLPGRAGLDLSLALSYNSLVWTRSGSSVLFDLNGGFPAPGFRLGFPTLRSKFYNRAADKFSYLLVTPSGARAELRQTSAQGVYEAVDSSYLQLRENADQSITLRTTDGTQLTYWVVAGAYRCTEVRDRNGNYITVEYNAAGDLWKVTDTLGRVVNFNYEGGHLKSVTQTWRRETEANSVATETHEWARFDYFDEPVTGKFTAGLTPQGPQNGTTIHALRKVTLADGSSFTFKYNPWGQVNRVEQRAKDAGLLNYASCDLPTDPNVAQSDCPRFTKYSVWAAYWNGDDDATPDAAEADTAVTSYKVTEGATWADPETDEPQTGTLAEQTAPDGTVYKEYSHASGWDAGLVRLSEVWAPEGGALTKQRRTSTRWTQDGAALTFLNNPRVEEVNIYDPPRTDPQGNTIPGRRQRTSVAYTSFGLPQEVKEYDAAAQTVLRRTRTEYVPATVTPGTPYTDRRIIGLPSEGTVYGTENGQEKLFSKVTYEYDLPDGTDPKGRPVKYLEDAGAVSRHYGHDATQNGGQGYGPAFRVRGQLCRVRRWDVEAPQTESRSVVSLTGYNTTGSVIFKMDAEGHKTSISYADPSGAPTTLAYPTKVTDPDGFFSTVEYNYDLGAVVRAVDPKGAVSRKLYDAAGRVMRAWNEVNEAYTAWDYAASGRYVRRLTKVDDDKPETFVMTVADGAGRVRGTLRELPGSTGGYAAQRFGYDKMGRQVEASNPTEVSVDQNDLSKVAAWQPAGDDAPAAGQTGWHFTTREYDWKGRPVKVISTDGKTQETLYGGCGCAGGEVVTTRDEVGRRLRVTRDVLGRVVKSQILTQQPKSEDISEGTDADVYSTVATTYNALDQITRVVQQAGVSGASQVSTNDYDGHGRVWKTHAPAQDEGKHTVYTYYADDTVETVTDARLAVTTYTYNGRRLVKTVDHDGAPAGLEDLTQVKFEYDEAGNRKRMDDALGWVTYEYDTLSRMKWEKRYFSALEGHPNNPYQITYTYTTGGALKTLTDPFGAQFTYGHDRTGALKQVTGSPFGDVTTYAADVKYRAWGAVKSATYHGGQVAQTTQFNKRMQPTEYRLTTAGISWQRLDYSYFDDGRIQAVTDLDDGLGSSPPSTLHFFSRAYTYDLAGRVLFSGGAEGRSVPYRQTYTYDEFNNLKSREGQYGYQSSPQSDTADYNAGGRRVGWTYDPDGRLKLSPANPSSHHREWHYDAAGRLVSTDETSSNGVTTLALSYDGDGRQAREATVGGASPSTYYMVRSSVLGGEVLTRLTAGGAKSFTYVPAGGLVEARQAIDNSNGVQAVGWTHNDPPGLSVVGGAYDPLGNLVTPVPPQPGGPPQPTSAGSYAPSYWGSVSTFSNANNYATGCMAASGRPADCNGVMQQGMPANSEFWANLPREYMGGGEMWRGEQAYQDRLDLDADTRLWGRAPVEGPARYGEGGALDSFIRRSAVPQTRMLDFNYGNKGVPFLSWEKSLLDQAFKMIISEKCKRWLDGLLGPIANAHFRSGSNTPPPPPSTEALLSMAAINKYNENLTAQQMGIPQSTRDRIAEKDGFFTYFHGVRVGNQIWLNDSAFHQGGLRTKSDLPAIIVHELLHVAGFDDAGKYNKEIQKHCGWGGDVGNSP